jgi:acyl carrier protein
LEYLGRIDGQVKIRGFRVEPGEIEAVLARHPGVREAVVLFRRDQPENKRLVAYLVPADQNTVIEASDLRAFCSDRLPDYMVPSAYVVMERLPLTANNKLDIAALPEPDFATRADNTSRVAPSSTEEKAIASIWREVLKIDQVSIDDNFFELGGHSLLVTQVATRISQAFDIDLPVRTLFERPTIAGISEEVKSLVESRIDQRHKLDAVLSRLKNLSPEERAALLRAKKHAAAKE